MSKTEQMARRAVADAAAGGSVWAPAMTLEGAERFRDAVTRRITETGAAVACELVRCDTALGGRWVGPGAEATDLWAVRITRRAPANAR